jgi:hypothetical protein
MAPTTRNTVRACTPPRPIEAKEFDTVKKTGFFRDYDRFHGKKTLAQISAENGTTDRTARRWLKQRCEIGSPAYRHTRKRSKVLGRRSRVSKETCKMLCSPSRNPVRDQQYEAQIAFHNIPVEKRQLQRKLKEHTNGGGRYRQAFVGKEISKKNLRERVSYGKEHKDKDIWSFWSYIFFTDEAHIDPSSMAQGSILRERGTRYDIENIQQKPEKKGVKFHVAAWVTWWDKAEKLEFYKDEEEYIQQPKRPRKPIRRKYDSEEDFEARMLEWEALLPHKQEVKPKGNGMTQKYYTERLLPVYINAIQKHRLQDSKPWILQEDGDPSCDSPSPDVTILARHATRQG